MLGRVETTLERLDGRMDRLEAQTAENVAVLKDHTRRSEALEAAVEVVRAELDPVKTHVAVFGALMKGVGVVGTVVGIITGVAKLLGVF